VVAVEEDEAEYLVERFPGSIQVALSYEGKQFPLLGDRVARILDLRLPDRSEAPRLLCPNGALFPRRISAKTRGNRLRFHEEPQVLHFGKPGTGLELKPGMIFTIEPMVNAGGREIKVLGDGWTVVTKDHSLSAQWEHTVVVTETGHEVLTLRKNETPPF